MSTDRGRGSAQGRSGTGGGGSPGWSGGCAALGGPGGPVHRGCASRCPGAGVSPAVLHSPVPRRCCTARCPGASGDSGASGPAHPRDPVPVTVAVLGAHRCPGADAGCSPSGAARPGAPELVGIPVPGVHPGADQLPLHHREGGGQQEGSLWLLVPVRTRPSGLHPPPQHSSPWQVTPHRDQAGDIRSQVREGRAVQGLGVPQAWCHQPGASRDPVVMPVPAAVMSESVAEAPGAASPAALGETGTSHELLQRLRELEVRRNGSATRQPWPLKPRPPCRQCQEPAVASALVMGCTFQLSTALVCHCSWGSPILPCVALSPTGRQRVCLVPLCPLSCPCSVLGRELSPGPGQ